MLISYHFQWYFHEAISSKHFKLISWLYWQLIKLTTRNPRPTMITEAAITLPKLPVTLILLQIVYLKSLAVETSGKTSVKSKAVWQINMRLTHSGFNRVSLNRTLFVNMGIIKAGYATVHYYRPLGGIAIVLVDKWVYLALIGCPHFEFWILTLILAE